MGRFDYDYGTAMNPVRRVTMETSSLDNTEIKYPIDFLSLDTQGSEMLILQGATVSLASIIGVETEVSFRPIYEDTKLFNEIYSYLNKLGFEFIRFTTLTLDAPRTMPTLGRLEKMHSFGDALFLRKPYPGMSDVQGRKVVFAALAYGQVEYAAHCVRELRLRVIGINEPGTWMQFVERFISVVNKETSLPQSLANTTNAEELASKFEVRSSPQRSLMQPLKYLKLAFTKLPRNLQIVIIRLVFAQHLVTYFLGKPSELETLYVDAGRHEMAKRLRISRFRRIFPLF